MSANDLFKSAGDFSAMTMFELSQARMEFVQKGQLDKLKKLDAFIDQLQTHRR